jgi:hypothetical protein
MLILKIPKKYCDDGFDSIRRLRHHEYIFLNKRNIVNNIKVNYYEDNLNRFM